jgi:hypothetical protein
MQIRQGDVYLYPVSELPSGCKPVAPEGGKRFVLAHGEVTGHAHAIYEFSDEMENEVALANAGEIADAVIARAMAKRNAQMWECPQGEWYLEIRKPSKMKHEEHTAPVVPIGIYHCPIQVESTASNMLRQVAD